MELRKFTWPGLRQRRWANFAWEGSEGVQKNWVPLRLHENHVLFSHSLEPHIVLRCSLPAAGAQGAAGSGGLYNRTIIDPNWPGGVRYEMAERPASPESKCTQVHKTSAAHVWRRARFHLYQGIARSTSIRAIPRGGTPCITAPFAAQSLVCASACTFRKLLTDPSTMPSPMSQAEVKLKGVCGAHRSIPTGARTQAWATFGRGCKSSTSGAPTSTSSTRSSRTLLSPSRTPRGRSASRPSERQLLMREAVVQTPRGSLLTPKS